MRHYLTLALPLVLLIGILALPAYATTYSMSDIGTSWSGATSIQAGCGTDSGGSSGSPVQGGYWDGTAGSAPAGFQDSPNHYCFYDNYQAYAGGQYKEVYGWIQYPNVYAGTGVTSTVCSEDNAPGTHDMCSNTSFYIKPPSITFTASPTWVPTGGSSTLTWSSSAADSCTSTDFVTNNTTSGSTIVTPPGETIYHLTCTGPGGQTTVTTSVSVGAINMTYNVSPTLINRGAMALASWSASGVSRCDAQGRTLSGAATDPLFTTNGQTSGSASVGPVNMSYTPMVNCVNAAGYGGGAGSAEYVMATLEASSTTITQGSATNLTYTCEDFGSDPYIIASSLTSDAGDTIPLVTHHGTVSVSPASTRTYTLSCTMFDNRTFTDTKTITVNPNTTSVSCTPLQNPVSPGQSVTFNAQPTGITNPTFGWKSPGGTPSFAVGQKGQTYSVSYAAPGNYSPDVTVTGDNIPNSVSASCQPVTVTGTPNSCGQSIQPSISAVPTRIVASNQFTLNWSATGVPAGSSCTITGPNIVGGTITTAPADTACNIATASTTASVTTQAIYTMSCGSGPTRKTTIVNVVPKFKEL